MVTYEGEASFTVSAPPLHIAVKRRAVVGDCAEFLVKIPPPKQNIVFGRNYNVRPSIILIISFNQRLRSGRWASGKFSSGRSRANGGRGRIRQGGLASAEVACVISRPSRSNPTVWRPRPRRGWSGLSLNGGWLIRTGRPRRRRFPPDLAAASLVTDVRLIGTGSSVIVAGSARRRTIDRSS